MTHTCWICLGQTEGKEYHSQCLKDLFGTHTAPRIDISQAKFHTAALAMAGHTTLSGVQRKISVSLTPDRLTLSVAAEGGRFILKPQTEKFPHLPENEHVTMCMAREAGLSVPPCGLISLADESIGYIVRRFDRLPNGKKLQQEDFCQLAGLLPAEKYDYSSEKCVALARHYASEPLVAVHDLFQTLLFSWWCGNGDLHLKNLSVLTGTDGVVQMSPAYDFVCTLLVIKDDPLALPVQGRRSNLSRRDWENFATHCKVPPAATRRTIDSLREAASACTGLIENSKLPAEFKAEYTEIIESRTQSLAS